MAIHNVNCIHTFGYMNSYCKLKSKSSFKQCILINNNITCFLQEENRPPEVKPKAILLTTESSEYKNIIERLNYLEKLYYNSTGDI